MENNQNDGTAREAADQQNDWQQAENRTTPEQTEDEQFDLRSAEANGYDGTESNAYSAGAEGEDYESDEEDEEEDDDFEEDEDDDLEEDDDSDDEDDETNNSDWGNVDPLNDGRSSSNDPTAPGSAV